MEGEKLVFFYLVMNFLEFYETRNVFTHFKSSYKASFVAQFILSVFILNIFILSIFINLYMFRATTCPSSGETTVSVIQEHMFLHTRQSSHTLTSTKCHINTVVSPDDSHIVARKM